MTWCCGRKFGTTGAMPETVRSQETEITTFILNKSDKGMIVGMDEYREQVWGSRESTSGDFMRQCCGLIVT